MNVESWDSMYWQHSAENYTYDNSTLRYGGPIPVFLYGAYNTYSFVQRVCQPRGCDHQTDFKYIRGNVLTEEKYIRFDRTTHGQTYNYPSFLLDNCWQFGDKGLEQFPVEGTLFTLSLKAIRALDFHFRNMSIFERELVFLDEKTTISGVDWAYTYFVRPSITCDGVQENKLTFKEPKSNIIWPTKIVRQSGKLTFVK